MYDSFIPRGIPVIIGEHGLHRSTWCSRRACRGGWTSGPTTRWSSQNASGTTTSFAIPTSFRGDPLATVEATYADGSVAGPADWTSYKEFTCAFEPNYADSSIALAITKTEVDGTNSMPTDFFTDEENGVRIPAVEDGAPVTLTFHFWSGTSVTYHITKNGTSVTGSTSGGGHRRPSLVSGRPRACLMRSKTGARLAADGRAGPAASSG